jgi:hypothetical protein
VRADRGLFFKALAANTRSLAESLVAFGTTEGHQPLAQGYRKLAGSLTRVAESEAARSVADCVTLGDGCMYEAAEAKEAKVCQLRICVSQADIC